VTNTPSFQKLPHYANPPVTEVAFSIFFSSIDILTPHIGRLWDEFQPNYPSCSDVAPLIPKVEIFNETIEAEFRFTDIPPLPRVWFISSDETRIIQIQRDCFIHNWRKIQPEDEYLRYEKLICEFKEHLSQLDSFLQEANLGRVHPKQYELIYVNQIPLGNGWQTLGDIGDIFPDFAWRSNSQRFLGNPKAISWTTTFEMPNQIGRLHVAIRHVMSDNVPMLSFELTARGIGEDKSLGNITNWFDVAHEWIVRGFADLTGEKFQNDIWNRVE
jgi:uncharacterized protein (TIGR04255 family)